MNNPAKIRSDGWNWQVHTDMHPAPALHNLYDHAGRLLAWVEARNSYCNRCHWKGLIEIPCGIDGQDGWPNYYMSLDRAKAEIEAFLMWRLFKLRCVE